LGGFPRRDLRMKIFLITGVTGFLGSKLARFLIEKNHQVIGLGRQNVNSLLSDLQRNPNFIYLQGSISEELLERLNPYSIQGVYHLASQIPSHDNISFNEYFEANVATTQKLISYFQTKQIDFFVYTSTNSVFGNPIQGKIDEQSIPTPLNYYGLTKYLAEKVIQIESPKLHAKAIIIRLCSLFGPRDTYGFLNTISNEFESNREVELFSKGNVYRALLFADDAVKLLAKLIYKYKDLDKFEIFQIAGERSYQTIELAELVKYFLNSNSPIILSDRQSRYDWDVFIDIKKAKEKLDFQPLTMEAGIQLYLNDKKNEL
jgi:nucleoside-diphosphate-sugar epimerase